MLAENSIVESKSAKRIFIQESDTAHAEQFGLWPAYVDAIKTYPPFGRNETILGGSNGFY